MALRRFSFQFTTDKKTVSIHCNGNYETGASLDIQSQWTFHDFIVAASNRINMHPKATIVYNSDGVAINDTMMMEDNDLVFLSTGEAFIHPPNNNKLRRSIHVGQVPNSLGGYRVGILLGKGAFGEVHLGEHQLNGESVALKFLRKSDILRDLDSLEQVSKEIQTMKALKHNNIIRLVHHMDSLHHMVLVFELMEGGDLLNYMLAQKKEYAMNEEERVCLSDEDAKLVFQQLLNAISYAHNQHICHRDLKLENILLKGKTLDVVKVGDFGLSDFYRPGATAKTEVGTLAFLAPEVFRGTSNSGPPLDVWALGVVLFTMLNGRLPFDGDNGATRSNSIKQRAEVITKDKILKAQYKFSDRLSPDSKDLIRRIFKLDPIERISIPEMLAHTWMKGFSSYHHGPTVVFPPPIKLPHPDSPTRKQHLSPLNKNASAFFNIESKTVTESVDPMPSTPTLPPLPVTPLALSRRVSSGESMKSRTNSNVSDVVEELTLEDSNCLPPLLDPLRRSSLNSKILQGMASPLLDLPNAEMQTGSVSMKEGSPTKPGGSKAVLTRLNRNKSQFVGEGANGFAPMIGDWWKQASFGSLCDKIDNVTEGLAGSGDDLKVTFDIKVEVEKSASKNVSSRKPSAGLARARSMKKSISKLTLLSLNETDT